MAKYLFFILAGITVGSNSCNRPSPTLNTSLAPKEFKEKINLVPSAEIIDVRTPEEFSKGHLQNARNVDWNGIDFQAEISKIDKSKPVFVYCLSGGRSSSAANQMRSDGFKEIYELSGGIMKWRAANLPETSSTRPTSTGMSHQQFDSLLTFDKLVLIDFYAEWCTPCKKMKPYLEEISKDRAGKVVVIRINADDNQQLCKELKIETLPVLQLYKNKTMTWTNTGYISKEGILKQLL
ncbi:MAG: thioredoxin domain-containing protein [Saprospiraceae bacterium]